MSWSHDLAERIRRDEPLPPFVGPVLSAATPIVRIGMWRRLNAPRSRLNAHVISYGNITAGGTGKTPAVIERVQQEIAAGKRVAVLTRGYGSAPASAPVVIQPESVDERLAQKIGDEPALIAQKAPGVVIAKGADRIAAGQQAIDRFECETLILDDGFQYVQLERDENVLVIDTTNPFGNGRLLPRGILREEQPALARATAIILTRCDQASNLEQTLDHIRRWNDHAPIRQTRHAPARFVRVSNGETVALDEMRGKSVVAVCAIGHPEAFHTTLESLNVSIADSHTFSDHQSIPYGALKNEIDVVVTEKDAVRFENPPRNVLALEIALCDWSD